MTKWFAELAAVQDPQRRELILFLSEVERLLAALLQDEGLVRTLWRNDPELRAMARDSFKADVVGGLAEMRLRLDTSAQDQEAVDFDAIEQGLREHALVGPSARFKYNVVARLARSWRTRNGHPTAGSGMRRVLEGVDAVLDSAISVVGAGGAVKEFKDVIAALGTNKGD